MKVAHIVGKLKKAGVESVVFTYLRHMDTSDMDIHVLYDADSLVPPPCDLVEAGIKFIEIPPYQNVIKYVSAVKKLCRENMYDIVHSHMNVLSVFSLYAAKSAGIKHRICHNHSTSSGYERKKDLLKKILRPTASLFATDLAACSELAARWMYGDKVFDSGAVTVFNNAIDIDRYRFNAEERESLRAELGFCDSFVVGHVGRFMEQKNHTFLIDIFEKLAQIRADAKLILVGEGERLAEIKEKVKEAGLSERVIFKGVVNDVERYYFAMDVFLLPSLYEGLPVVALEAQAAGLPCVISDAVTKECKVISDVSFLPVNRDVSLWAKTVSECAADERTASNDIFKDGKFNIENSADSMKKYYLELLEGDKKGGRAL